MLRSTLKQKSMLPLASRSNRGCPHELYESSERFVSHILGFLAGRSPDALLKQIESPKRIICNHCWNHLFAKIAIGRFYALTIPKMVCEYRAIFRRLYGEMMLYPKMYKLMMKECPLNKSVYRRAESISGSIASPFPNMFTLDSYIYDHNFGAICQLMMSISLSMRFSDKYTEIRLKREHLNKVAILRTLWLSMKYWNKYHIRYFANHHLVMMSTTYRVFMGYFHSDKYPGVPITPYNDDYYRYLRLCIDTVCVKAMRMGLKGITEDWIPPSEAADLNVRCLIQKVALTDKHCLFHYLPQEERDEEMKLLRRKASRALVNTIPCGWTGCKRQANHSGGNIKKCGHCKMAFYCSRKCQKKAWKRFHRHRCSQLCKRY